MNDVNRQFVIQTYSQPYGPPAWLLTPNNSERAGEDRVEAYAKFVMDLAKRFTNSPEEAAAAVEEMNADIRQCAEDGQPNLSPEQRAVAREAFRKLTKFLK